MSLAGFDWDAFDQVLANQGPKSLSSLANPGPTQPHEVAIPSTSAQTPTYTHVSSSTGPTRTPTKSLYGGGRSSTNRQLQTSNQLGLPQPQHQYGQSGRDNNKIAYPSTNHHDPTSSTNPHPTHFPTLSTAATGHSQSTPHQYGVSSSKVSIAPPMNIQSPTPRPSAPASTPTPSSLSSSSVSRFLPPSSTPSHQSPPTQSLPQAHHHPPVSMSRAGLTPSLDYSFTHSIANRSTSAFASSTSSSTSSSSSSMSSSLSSPSSSTTSTPPMSHQAKAQAAMRNQPSIFSAFKTSPTHPPSHPPHVHSARADSSIAQPYSSSSSLSSSSSSLSSSSSSTSSSLSDASLVVEAMEPADPLPPPILDEICRDYALANPRALPPDPSTVGTWVYPEDPVLMPRRDYQYRIARAALHQDTLVSVPTGLGKTMIAVVVMVNIYRWFPQGRIVFLAPTCNLVAQQHRAFLKMSGIPEDQCCVLTGDTPLPKRPLLWRTRRIIFATPQTFQSDLDKAAADPSLITCVVVDEAHRAKGKYAYTTSVATLRSRGARFRVLALSATPGRSLLDVQHVVNNLGINRIEVRTKEDPDVREYLFVTQEEKIVVELSSIVRSVYDALNRLYAEHLSQMKRKGFIPEDEPIGMTWSKLDSYRNSARHKFGTITSQLRIEMEGMYGVAMMFAQAALRLIIYGVSACRKAFITGLQPKNGKLSYQKRRLQSDARFNTFLVLMTNIIQAGGEYADVSNTQPNQVLTNPNTNMSVLSSPSLTYNPRFLPSSSSPIPGPSSMEQYAANHPKLHALLDLLLQHFLGYGPTTTQPPFPPTTSTTVGTPSYPLNCSSYQQMSHNDDDHLAPPTTSGASTSTNSSSSIPSPPLHRPPPGRVIVFTRVRDSVQLIINMLRSHAPLIKASAFVGQATPRDELEIDRASGWSEGAWDDDIDAKDDGSKRTKGGKGKKGKVKGGESVMWNDDDPWSDMDGDDGEAKLSTHKQYALRPLGPAMSGMTQLEQQRVLASFKAGETNTLVATSVAEEGLDIGEVSLIVSFDASRSPIEMIQRMGRTGRAADGRCVTLVTSGIEERMYEHNKQASESVLRQLKNDRGRNLKLSQVPTRLLPTNLIPVYRPVKPGCCIEGLSTNTEEEEDKKRQSGHDAKSVNKSETVPTKKRGKAKKGEGSRQESEGDVSQVKKRKRGEVELAADDVDITTKDNESAQRPTKRTRMSTTRNGEKVNASHGTTGDGKGMDDGDDALIIREHGDDDDGDDLLSGWQAGVASSSLPSKRTTTTTTTATTATTTTATTTTATNQEVTDCDKGASTAASVGHVKKKPKGKTAKKKPKADASMPDSTIHEVEGETHVHGIHSPGSSAFIPIVLPKTGPSLKLLREILNAVRSTMGEDEVEYIETYFKLDPEEEHALAARRRPLVLASGRAVDVEASAYPLQAVTGECDALTVEANNWYCQSGLVIPDIPTSEEASVALDTLFETYGSIGFRSKDVRLYTHDERLDTRLHSPKPIDVGSTIPLKKRKSVKPRSTKQQPSTTEETVLNPNQSPPEQLSKIVEARESFVETPEALRSLNKFSRLPAPRKIGRAVASSILGDLRQILNPVDNQIHEQSRGDSEILDNTCQPLTFGRLHSHLDEASSSTPSNVPSTDKQLRAHTRGMALVDALKASLRHNQKESQADSTEMQSNYHQFLPLTSSLPRVIHPRLPTPHLRVKPRLIPPSLEEEVEHEGSSLFYDLMETEVVPASETASGNPLASSSFSTHVLQQCSGTQDSEALSQASLPFFSQDTSSTTPRKSKALLGCPPTFLAPPPRFLHMTHRPPTDLHDPTSQLASPFNDNKQASQCSSSNSTSSPTGSPTAHACTSRLPVSHPLPPPPLPPLSPMPSGTQHPHTSMVDRVHHTDHTVLPHPALSSQRQPIGTETTKVTGTYLGIDMVHEKHVTSQCEGILMSLPMTNQGTISLGEDEVTPLVKRRGRITRRILGSDTQETQTNEFNKEEEAQEEEKGYQHQSLPFPSLDETFSSSSDMSQSPTLRRFKTGIASKVLKSKQRGHKKVVKARRKSKYLADEAEVSDSNGEDEVDEDDSEGSLVDFVVNTDEEEDDDDDGNENESENENENENENDGQSAAIKKKRLKAIDQWQTYQLGLGGRNPRQQNRRISSLDPNDVYTQDFISQRVENTRGAMGRILLRAAHVAAEEERQKRAALAQGFEWDDESEDGSELRTECDEGEEMRKTNKADSVILSNDSGYYASDVEQDTSQLSMYDDQGVNADIRKEKKTGSALPQVPTPSYTEALSCDTITPRQLNGKRPTESLPTLSLSKPIVATITSSCTSSSSTSSPINNSTNSPLRQQQKQQQQLRSLTATPSASPTNTVPLDPIALEAFFTLPTIVSRNVDSSVKPPSGSWYGQVLISDNVTKNTYHGSLPTLLRSPQYSICVMVMPRWTTQTLDPCVIPNKDTALLVCPFFHIHKRGHRIPLLARVSRALALYPRVIVAVKPPADETNPYMAHEIPYITANRTLATLTSHPRTSLIFADTALLANVASRLATSSPVLSQLSLPGAIASMRFRNELSLFLSIPGISLPTIASAFVACDYSVKTLIDKASTGASSDTNKQAISAREQLGFTLNQCRVITDFVNVSITSEEPK